MGCSYALSQRGRIRMGEDELVQWGFLPDENDDGAYKAIVPLRLGER